MPNKMYYMHTRTGDIVEVKIRDGNYRILEKFKFNVRDKNAIVNLIGVLEKYSGFSVVEIIREKLKIGEWI